MANSAPIFLLPVPSLSAATIVSFVAKATVNSPHRARLSVVACAQTSLPSPLGKNVLFATNPTDYQGTAPYNDLHLPPGNGEVKREQSQIYLNSAERTSHLKAQLYNGAAKREQSQIYLNSAEQASHLKTEFYNGEVSESNDKLLGLAKC